MAASTALRSVQLLDLLWCPTAGPSVAILCIHGHLRRLATIECENLGLVVRWVSPFPLSPSNFRRWQGARWAAFLLVLPDAEGDAEGVIQYSLGRSPGNRRYGDSPALKARFKNGPISFESRLQRCNCDPPESWGFAPGYTE